MKGRKQAEKNSCEPAGENNRKPLIDYILDYIHLNYNQEIKRDQLAKLINVSGKYLGALFKKETGETIAEYVTALRIRKAKERLVSTKDRVGEIAEAVGYQDEFYFSRVFKQITGKSPMVFIRKPMKIASLWYDYTFDLLALGIIPEVAMVDTWGEARRFSRQLGLNGQQQYCWSRENDKRDRLLENTNLDFIVVNDSNDETEVDLWRKRHSVVQIPWEGMNWRTHFQMIAEMVNKRRYAEEWLERYDAKADGVRRQVMKIIGQQDTVAIFNIRSDNSFYIYGDDRMGGDVLYRSLKLKPPKVIANEIIRDGQWPNILPEQVMKYNADHIFLAVNVGDRAAMVRMKQIMSQPTWQSLEAVRNNHIYIVDHRKWYGYSPLCIQTQLNDVQRLLCH
jgi:ABC-type Fe3+-hydroxamate transport system substrate-binding protein